MPALAVAVVLADSSIVTLGLPAVVRDFDTSVAAVSWVLISFNLVLALAALPAAGQVRAAGTSRMWRLGIAAFAGASLACALAPGLGVLLAARCVQALGGAAVVSAALELLCAELDQRRAVTVWGGAGIAGAAIGPALGGALTELFSWRAIFIVQVPLVLLVWIGRGAGRAAPGRALREPPPAWILAALALISAALTAALFLLVVMLIEGWRLSPAAAAGVVTIMPAAALLTAPLASRIGEPRVRATTGTVAVAGGLGALGLLPGAGVGWTIAPQVLIGFGLATALSALIGGALAGPGAVAPRAAWTIAARHGGVVLGLALLTPIFTSELDRQEVAAQRAGSSLLLDANLRPGLKIQLGKRLADRVDAADGRLPRLAPAFRGLDADPDERAPLARLKDRLTDEVKRAATQAFSRSFLAGAGLALLVLLPLALSRRGRPT